MATPAKIETRNFPTVALIGRVNVGKSTLFNRLIEKDKAIVSPIPGTTRTNNEGLILWRKKFVKLIDTGGLTFDGNVALEEDIIKQSERAIEEADLIIFVVDTQAGVLPQEKELAKLLKRKATNKPIILLANKVDSQKIENNLHAPEWYKLNFGEPYPVSGANGRNLGNFLDFLYKKLGQTKRHPKISKFKKEEIINIAIIGKPNVGKSSLFNKLIGEDKVIVNPLAHTTREPHDILVRYEYDTSRPGNGSSPYKGKARRAERVRKGVLVNFIDTAGIRRKAQVKGQIERQGISKSIKAIEDADIVIFVLDGSEPISSQDRQLGGLLENKAKSVILVINKWDLAVDNSDHNRNEVKKMIYGQFPHVDYAPIVFTSGLTGYRAHDIFPMLIKIWNARHTEIPNSALYQFIKNTTHKHLPSRDKGVRHPEILGFQQLNTNPPVFKLFIKPRTSLHISYVHFIENELRNQFDFFGTPIIIRLTKMRR